MRKRYHVEILLTHSLEMGATYSTSVNFSVSEMSESLAVTTAFMLLHRESIFGQMTPRDFRVEEEKL